MVSSLHGTVRIPLPRLCVHSKSKTSRTVSSVFVFTPILERVVSCRVNGTRTSIKHEVAVVEFGLQRVDSTKECRRTVFELAQTLRNDRRSWLLFCNLGRTVVTIRSKNITGDILQWQIVVFCGPCVYF